MLKARYMFKLVDSMHEYKKCADAIVFSKTEDLDSKINNIEKMIFLLQDAKQRLIFFKNTDDQYLNNNTALGRDD